MKLLDSRFMIFTDLSPQDFEKVINNKFTPELLKNMKKLENDFSKFDKCLGKLLLSAEMEIYRRLGMPTELLQLWYAAHEHTVLKDRFNNIKAWIDFQRKSGTASTFFGNTLVTMIVMAMVYDMHEVIIAFFAGDDSLLYSVSDFQDRTVYMAQMFNLEAKVLRYKYSYFCSKFLLFDDSRFYFVPDPVKLVSKLGRKDLRNYDHVEEYRTSLVDLVAVYNNPIVSDLLTDAVNERYYYLEY